MKIIDFTEVNFRISEDQEGYLTLPAYDNNMEGTIVYGYKLDTEEMKKIQEAGEIWIKQLNYRETLHPVLIYSMKANLLILTEDDDINKQVFK